MPGDIGTSHVFDLEEENAKLHEQIRKLTHIMDGMRGLIDKNLLTFSKEDLQQVISLSTAAIAVLKEVDDA